MHRGFGMTLSELANLYGVSIHAIRRSLERRGVEIGRVQRPRWGRRSLSQSEEQEAIEAYESGMSDTDIGKVFGVDHKTIGAIRKRHGVPTRLQRKFSDQQDLEVRASYLAGTSIHDLAQVYGSSVGAIQKSLKRTNTSSRESGVSKRKGPQPYEHAIKPEDVSYLAQLYREGMKTKDLAELFDVSSKTVQTTLRRYGYERRGVGAFDPEEHLITGLEPQLVEDYFSGMTEEELVEKYAITPREVREAIDRHLGAYMRKAQNPRIRDLDGAIAIASLTALLFGLGMFIRRYGQAPSR